MDTTRITPRKSPRRLSTDRRATASVSCACLLQRAPDEEAQLGVIQFLGPLSMTTVSGCVAAKVTSAPVPRTTARRTGAPSWSRSSRKTASALAGAASLRRERPPHGVSQPRRAPARAARGARPVAQGMLGHRRAPGGRRGRLSPPQALDAALSTRSGSRNSARPRAARAKASRRSAVVDGPQVARGRHPPDRPAHREGRRHTSPPRIAAAWPCAWSQRTASSFSKMPLSSGSLRAPLSLPPEAGTVGAAGL